MLLYTYTVEKEGGRRMWEKSDDGASFIIESQSVSQLCKTEHLHLLFFQLMSLYSITSVHLGNKTQTLWIPRSRAFSWDLTFASIQERR